MRALSAAQNINTGTPDYPNGRARNKATGIPGTIWNESLMGDLIQLIQKVIIDAGITPNGNPDNVTNGYQILQAFDNRFVKTRVVEIGAWNMSTPFKQVAIPINPLKVVSIEIIIRNDVGDFIFNALAGDGYTNQNPSLRFDYEANLPGADTTGVYMTVNTPGPVGQALAQYASTSISRGFITIKYID